MSREIRFRLWSNSQNKYMDGPQRFVWAMNDGKVTELSIPQDLDGVLEQYTGLKDGNGKEIYEGDIVTMEYDLNDLETSDCSVVTFSDGCFRIGDGYENEAGSYLSDWQIIGNIHENPELLGGENE